MRILIVKTSAIGDVTHTLPSLNALRREFPKAHITWLIEEEAADIIRGHPALDRIIISKRKSWIRDLKRGQWRIIGEICRFLQEIRDSRYDLLIDFQGLLKSSVLIALCRAKRKAGFGRGMEHSECSHLFLNERLPPVDMNIHAVRRELLLLEGLGIKTGRVVYNLPVADTDKTAAGEILREAKIEPGQPLIALNPATTWQTKHWNDRAFAELADLLLDHRFNPVFTGSPQDSPAITNIIRLMRGKAVNLAGRTSLKTLAALYTLTDLVISTDTGPMHIAAAAGTPVVAIFGPTAPWRTGPCGSQHTIMRAGLPCSPCFKKKCPQADNACMRQITAGAVYTAALKIIETHR